MATGNHRAPGLPSIVQKTAPTSRRAAATPTFGGTPLSVDGITRDAMGSSSLLGSAIPKGIAASTIGTSHANAASDLTNSQASAQADISETLAQLNVIAQGRAARAAARSAEANPNSSTAITIQSPRLMAHGRGPLTVILGMNEGDTNRVVAMFEKFGYTINRALTPTRLDAMTHFTYWKTTEATVVGNVPQENRQTIAQAFNGGVTLWNDISEIGTDVTAANAPVTGISY